MTGALVSSWSRCVTRSVVLMGLLAIAPPVGAQPAATAILDRVQVNPRRPIDFHAVALPESVYVGQQVTYQVAVLLSADARSKLRRNPEFVPPELRGLMAYDLGPSIKVAARLFDGVPYEAHIFQRALFPVESGLQGIPGPQLTYNLPASNSYYSREEQFLVRAESTTVVAKPLPVEGRPTDYAGAVGVLRMAARLDSTTARVGEPLVLTVRVQGTGNVKLFPRPTLELPWATLVAGTERVQIDSGGVMVRGTKEFEWILTPTRDGRDTLPALRYPYFDPYAGRYQVAESAPLTFTVRPGAIAAPGDSTTDVTLPLRPLAEPLGGTSTPDRLTRLWWLVLALLPLPALWSLRAPRPSMATPSAIGTSRTVSATRDEPLTPSAPVSAPRRTARAARRLLLDGLAARLSLPADRLASRIAVQRALRRHGVSKPLTRDVMQLLEALDRLGFAPESAGAGTDTERAAALAPELLRRVEQEAVTPATGRRLGAMLSLVGCIVLLGGVRPLQAAVTLTAPQAPAPTMRTDAHPALQPVLPTVSADAVAAAAGAYARRRFAEAERQYAVLVAQQPTNSALLVNWGTAAWQAADTVSAVVAWQRAARIEPLAVDLQERLALLPAGARGGIADVPLIPVSALWRGAQLLWCLGWLLLAGWGWRRRRQPNGANHPTASWLVRTAVGMVLAGLALGGGAWWGQRQLDPTGLAVVTRPETMRLVPGADADALGGVTTGDVVRVLESRDGWMRAQHADGRRGWLPTARLVAVSARPLIR